MIDKILSQSKAIRTPVLNEVKEKLFDIKPDLESIAPYSTNIKEWLKPIIDLSEFYVYPMNGITEGLNWWFNREIRSVKMYDGDYQWISPIKRSNIDILYLSCPSAINGNYIEIPTDIPVALDLAYIGSTNIKKINVTPNIEYVFYSLSKTFGLRNIRTGWFFTRHQDNKLDQLVNNAKYYNYYANQISETIIKNFPIDYIYKKFFQEQKKLCTDLNITPSDVVWLGTSNDKKWDKFKRTLNINRICLANFFKN